MRTGASVTWRHGPTFSYHLRVSCKTINCLPFRRCGRICFIS
jgi:hypothetical protein